MTDNAEVPSRSYPREETFAAFVARGVRGSRPPRGVHPPLDKSGLPGWAWRLIAWALAVVTLVLIAHNGWTALLLFLVVPLLWLVHPRFWVATTVQLIFGLGVGAAAFAKGDRSWWVSAMVETLVSLFGGTWLTWVQAARVDVVRVLADKEKVLTALAHTQGELAAAERAAGIAAEHERWSREVHDTLAQGFISVITLAQAARGELDSGEIGMVIRRLDQLEAVGRDNLAESRALVAGEGPSALKDGDLAQALRRLVSVQRERGLNTGLELDLPVGLSSAVQVAILRTAQEGLSNVTRHAHAERVEVIVGVESTGLGRELVVTVADDGVGTGGRPEGKGLTGMRSRVEGLGGTLTVDPLHSPDECRHVGTVIEARMPL